MSRLWFVFLMSGFAAAQINCEPFTLALDYQCAIFSKLPKHKKLYEKTGKCVLLFCQFILMMKETYIH